MAMTGKERALKSYYKKRKEQQTRLWNGIVDYILEEITDPEYSRERLVDNLVNSGLRILKEDPRVIKRRQTEDYNNEQ